ncbi:MAG: glutamine synthetase family protein [Acidimicrobiia bacterium]|nr:MAG: glutamine synthetase family protein [Acidimicrobiia bacterium]
MAQVRGKLDIEELAARVDADAIDTVIVAFTDHYGRVHGKRFDATFFLDDVAGAGTHGCDYLLTVDMDMVPVAGYRYANWELGYGDFHMVPDLSTMRVAGWLPSSAIVLCDLIDDATHELVPVAPRSILRRQIDKLDALGFTAKAASELEYYLYEESYREAADNGFQNLTSVGWYSEDYHLMQGAREEFYNGAVRRNLAASGIPVENSKGETGRGQHEMNIRYADVLEMADRHTIMKLLMKDTADQLGISATFMAKPETDQAGSSCHIHLSLWSGEENAFTGDTQIGPIRCSDTFSHFLGGWMGTVGDLMPFFAPTVNSYKRFQEASWAPTNIAWSYDNRTAGFRIVGSGPSLRIECRIPGADVNPYLAYAAALAAGTYGIENKVDPPEMFSGDVYAAQDLPRVPATLSAAIGLFAESGFARTAFTADVQDHYAHFYSVEAAAYDAAVTDWERVRYFDRI